MIPGGSQGAGDAGGADGVDGNGAGHISQEGSHERDQNS